MKLINLEGKKFERWTVMEKVDNNIRNETMYKCVCDCGKESIIMAANLRKGISKSCGCLRHEIKSTHGHAGNGKWSREYNTWSSMMRRCHNPKATGFKHYGGRGIKVCDAWKSFEGFLSDMGDRPELHSLDRIDCNGDYEPNNCKWSTVTEQSINTRVRSNSKSGYKGIGWEPRRNKWRTRITVEKKSIQIGEFTHLHEAIKARKEAELKYWGKSS